jgi:hypothetical protein
MSKNALRLGTLVLTSVAVLGAGGASASAGTPAAVPASLSSVQAKAAAAITLRVNDLNAAIAKVNSAKDLGADAAQLASYLQADIDPLQVLGQKIAADTTVAAAQADAATIYTSFRVLALVLPAAGVAGVADGIDVTAIPYLTTLSTKAQSKVNAANQAALQPLIDDLNAQIGAANNATSGLATGVLGDIPSQWNANHGLLAPAAGSVHTAVAAIAKARSDVRQIRASFTSTKTAPAAVPSTTATTA